MSATLKKFLTILATLAFFIAVVNVIIDNPYTSRAITALVNDFIEKHAPVKIDFQAVSLRAFPPKLKIFGIKITEKPLLPQPADSKPLTLLRLESVELGVSAQSLLFGSTKFLKLALMGPVLDDLSMANLQLLMDSVPSRSTAQSTNSDLRIPWIDILEKLPLAVFSVDHARFEYSKKLSNDQVFKVLLLDAEATLNLDDRNNASVSLHSDGFNLVLNELSLVRTGKVRASLEVQTNQTAQIGLSIKDPGVEMGATGNLTLDLKNDSLGRWVEKLKAAIKYDVKIDLENFCKTAGIETAGNRGFAHMSGTSILQASLAKQFRILDLKGEADFDSQKLSFMGYALGDLKIKGIHSQKEIEFEELLMSDDGHALLSASGKLAGLDTGKPALSAKAKTVNKLSLSRILKAADVDFSEFDFDLNADEVFVSGSFSPFQLDIRSPSPQLKSLRISSLYEKIQSKSISPIDCAGPLHLSFNENQLEVKQAPLSCFIVGAQTSSSSSNSLIYVSGPITYSEKSGMALLVSSQNFNFELLKSLLDIPTSGSGIVTLKVAGPYNRVGVDIDAEADSITAYGTALKDLKAKIEIVDSALSWNAENVTFQYGGRIRNTQGTLSLDDSLILKASLTANDISRDSTAGFFKYFGLDNFAGKITNVDTELEFHLGLDSYFPIGKLSAEGSDWIFGESGKIDWFKTDLDFSEEKFEITRILAEIGRLQVEAKGQAQTQKPMRPKGDQWYPYLRMKENSLVDLQINLSENNAVSKNALQAPLQDIPYLGEFLSRLKLNGNLGGHATASGRLNDLSAKIDLDLTQASLAETRLSDFKIRGRVVKNKLETVLTQTDKTLAAEFKVDLNSRQLNYEWSVGASRWNIAPYLFGSLLTDARNYMFLSASSAMEGSLSDFWKTSRGQITVSQLRGRFFNPTSRSNPPLDLSLLGTSTLNLAQGRLKLNQPRIELSGEAVQLNITPRGELRVPEKIDFGLDGLVNLAVLRQFFPIIETSSGILKVSGHIHGPVDDLNPELIISNEIDVEKLNADLVKTGDVSTSIGIELARPAMTNIDLNLAISKAGIDIKSLQANKGPGRISASGFISFSKEEANKSRVTVNLDRASFIHNSSILKTIETEISGNFTLATGKNPILISGNLEIDRARNLQNVDIRDKILEFVQTRRFNVEGGSEEPSVAFDLNIQAKDTIKIRNRNVNVEASCNINLAGDNVAPVLTGQVVVNRGSFSYKYRREFRISQGLFTFDDPLSLDPKIDLNAQSEISTYRVNMAVSGRASDPRIDLSCDPSIRPDGLAVTKVDIVGLISSGKMNTNAKSNISAGDTAAVETLNLVVGKFEEPLEKFLDWSGLGVVQTLNIDTYADDTGKPIPRLSVPLNLHDDWDVVFSADDANQKMSLGYDINRDISLSGSVDRKNSRESAESINRQNSTDTGVDLKFRFSFP